MLFGVLYGWIFSFSFFHVYYYFIYFRVDFILPWFFLLGFVCLVVLLVLFVLFIFPVRIMSAAMYLKGLLSLLGWLFSGCLRQFSIFEITTLLPSV